MSLKNCLAGVFAMVCGILFNCSRGIAQDEKSFSKYYYVSTAGSDSNPGTMTAPFKTIQKIDSLDLKPGTIVYFKAGETFNGTLTIGKNKTGSPTRWVAFSTYGVGKAIINADSVRAVSLYNSRFVIIMNLKLTGLGRKTGNHENGLAILNSRDIRVDNIDISGFQKSGLLIDSSSWVNCNGIFAHDNGSAGITVEGRGSKKDSRNIKIYGCRAENNPGDPTKLDNHSGNGIVVGHCTNVDIEECTATNNGWDMPRIGNGPVGIWCYEADSVRIKSCLSYENKTSKGGADGGGFDLDGGTTNSVISYCYSYGNQGSGYCIFQYWGASPWHDNIICNNISENDGTVSDSQGGMYIWNSSGNPRLFYNCKVYDNIVYNSKVAALSFSEKSLNHNFEFYHNIFVGKDALIKGVDYFGTASFMGNDWWSLDSKFNAWGFKDFKAWATKFGLEQMYGHVVGLNIDPGFKNPNITGITTLGAVELFSGYRLSEASLLKKLFGGDLDQAVFERRTF